MSNPSRKFLRVLPAIAVALSMSCAIAQTTDPATQPATPLPPAATTVMPAPVPQGMPAATTPAPSTPATPTTSESTAAKDASDKPAAPNGDRHWAKLDKNSDGNLSKTEAAGDPELLRVFAKADGNHDGILTPDEYRDFYNANFQAGVTRKK